MVLFLLAVLSFIIFGCSEDSVAPPSIPPEVDLIAVICNPLAPAPADTAILTAQVAGKGGWANFEWSASGGTLLDNGSITARWLVPAQKGSYDIRVIASIDGVSDTMSAHILVREFSDLSTGVRYSFYPVMVEGELFFLGSPISQTNKAFRGYHAYRWEDRAVCITTNEDPLIDGGYEFVFSSDGLLASVVTGGSEFLRQQPINLIKFPLIAGPKSFVTNNEIGGSIFRKNQHVHPSTNIDLSTVVWQKNQAGPADDGTKDLINIMFRDGLAPIVQLTTSKDSTFVLGGWRYRYFRNIKPIFTPDYKAIVYFVDSTKTFEPCILPMQGSTPLVDQKRAFMVDSKHGIFFYAGVSVGEETIFEWKPLSNSQLVFIDKGKKLCLLDISSESVEVLEEGVFEFSFAEDGTIALVKADGVYIGPLGGSLDCIYVKERSTDDVLGVTWSPGSVNKRLVFRMVRKGASADETFSAFIIYFMDEDRWYFASPRIPGGSEPSLPDYRWRRATFEALGTGFLMPASTQSNTGISEMHIFRSA